MHDFDHGTCQIGAKLIRPPGGCGLGCTSLNLLAVRGDLYRVIHSSDLSTKEQSTAVAGIVTP